MKHERRSKPKRPLITGIRTLKSPSLFGLPRQTSSLCSGQATPPSRPPEMTPGPPTSSSAVGRRHGPGLLPACVGSAGGRGILGNDRGQPGGWLRPAGSTHAGAVGGGGCRARSSGTWSSRGRRRAPGASRGLTGRPRRRATWTCPPLRPTTRRCLAAAPR